MVHYTAPPPVSNAQAVRGSPVTQMDGTLDGACKGRDVTLVTTQMVHKLEGGSCDYANGAPLGGAYLHGTYHAARWNAPVTPPTVGIRGGLRRR